MFFQRKFQENEIVKDNKGAEWKVVGYEMGLVLVAPNNKKAEKEFGRVYMPECMLIKVQKNA